MNTKRLAIAMLAAAAWAFASNTNAATKFWKNTVGSGNWSVSNNWSAVSAAGSDNGGVPVAGEPVRIVHTTGVSHMVLVDATTPTLGSLAIDLTGAGATTNTLSITTNVNLTAASINVGGHSGTAPTAGRGALFQSAGTVTSTSGLDIAIGNGAGSTGTYTLSGTGALNVPQSLYVGLNGTGTFHHSGGINTILAGTVGALDVGVFAGSTGTYNLSGAGQLISNKSEYVGDFATGIFNHTGGSNTINGANDLILGNSSGGNGTYTISGNGALTIGRNLVVGESGTGTLNVQGNSNVHIGGALNIGAFDTVNMSGGTLRLNTYSRNSFGTLNYTGGTIRLGGSLRILGTDPTIAEFFGAINTIPTGKGLIVEGQMWVDGNVNVNGGTLQSLTSGFIIAEGADATLAITNGGSVSAAGGGFVGPTFFSELHDGTLSVDGLASSFSTDGALRIAPLVGSGTLQVTNGGAVYCESAKLSEDNRALGTATVSGPGALWNITNGLEIGTAVDAVGHLTIESGGTVFVGTQLSVNSLSDVNINGGTLRFDSISTTTPADRIHYNAGTIKLSSNRTIGTDTYIDTFFGAAAVIPSGKGLTVEGIATFNDTLAVDGGVLTVGSLASADELQLVRGTLNVMSQNLTISSSGPLGSALDVDENVKVNVTLGITNQGLVTGDGEIGGTFSNAASGELRAEPGRSLKLTGASNTNAGQFNLYGGMLDFTQNLTNNAGAFISGSGTLKVATLLTNRGTMNFSGLANIVGDVTNTATGKVISSGGGPTTFHDDVTNQAGSEIRTSIGSFTVFFGAVTGTSNFTGTGTVNFEGDLKPGSSPAQLNFAGNVGFGADASLEIEIGGTTPGTQHDKLNIAGSLALDGALEVSLINGFNPSAGQSFNILDWGSLAGTFSSFTLPTLSGLSWNLSQLYTTGVLSVAAALTIPGDFNNNGYVDAADYVVWRKNTANGPLPNDNGLTNQTARFTLWRANFGNTVFTGSGSGAESANGSVPEPACCTLVLIAVLCASAGRRFTGCVDTRTSFA